MWDPLSTTWKRSVVTKFGDKLRNLRFDAGLSQAALAREIQVAPSYLSLVERGLRKPPSPRIIKKLEKALLAPNLLADLTNRIPEDLLKALHRPEVQRSVRNHLIVTFPWFSH